LAPKATPFNALQAASWPTECVAEAPMVVATVIKADINTLPRRPRKFSCSGSANVVPKIPAENMGIALSIPKIQRSAVLPAQSLPTTHNPKSLGIPLIVLLLADCVQPWIAPMYSGTESAKVSWAQYSRGTQQCHNMSQLTNLRGSTP
jgi:hypothetical protein